MIKNILKEVIIILLLCVIITVILGVIFYEYNPIGKVVPSKISYTVPENIAAELQSTNQVTGTELTPQNKVYTINDSDLNLYKKSKAYNPSSENPFSNTLDGDSVASEGTTTSKVGSKSTGTSSSSSSSSSSTGSATGSSTSNDNTGSSSSNSGTEQASSGESTGSLSSSSGSTASTDTGSQATGKKAKLK